MGRDKHLGFGADAVLDRVAVTRRRRIVDEP